MSRATIARIQAIADRFVVATACICIGVALAMIGMSTGLLP